MLELSIGENMLGAESVCVELDRSGSSIEYLMVVVGRYVLDCVLCRFGLELIGTWIAGGLETILTEISGILRHVHEG